MELWSIAAVSAATAVIASIADHRRAKRRDLENPGFMPWSFITVMAVMIALITTAFALKLHQ